MSLELVSSNNSFGIHGLVVPLIARMRMTIQMTAPKMKRKDRAPAINAVWLIELSLPVSCPALSDLVDAELRKARFFPSQPMAVWQAIDQA